MVKDQISNTSLKTKTTEYWEKIKMALGDHWYIIIIGLVVAVLLFGGLRQ